MAKIVSLLLAGAALELLSTLPAQAQLPPRDLVVELRQIREPEAHTARTQPATAPLATQRIQVGNGEKATLRMDQRLPVRFVQAAGGGSDAQTGASGGGVRYGMVWMQAGQSMAVQPRWPGARQPVRTTIAVESSSLEGPTGNAELPRQARSQLATTVSAPLGQWVTVAATGGEPAPPGSYNSEAAADTRQLVQIRVLAP